MPVKKLFLTGATGLLGRAIYSTFLKEGWAVYAVGFSRIKEGVNKLDITDKVAVLKAVTDFKPNIIIHSAAQRYPDVVDKNPELASTTNVDATRHIAEAAASVGCPVIYISTDYVFDGKDAPYSVSDKPNPLNIYGKTKLEGEVVTLGISFNNIVLRIPVLYGPVEKLSESAVTALFEPLQNSSKTTDVSHYERRRPSHVNDIAVICLQLSSGVFDGNTDIKGVYQWCGSEELTKYDMVVRMSKLFGISCDHIRPVIDSGTGTTTRPYNTTLDVSRLAGLGYGQHTSFDVGIKDVLSPWYKK